MKRFKYVLLAAALTAVGCSDESTGKPDGGALVTPDGGSTNPDGGGSTGPDAGATNPDGGGITPDSGTTATTLVEFVTDIVKNKSNETAIPESIDDKTLTDTMDPAAFNALF